MPNPQLPRKKKPPGVVGSLARRILLVCLGLLIIPLMIHSLLLWDKDLRLKIHDLFVDLELVGEGEKQLVHQWILLQERNLALVDLLVAGHSEQEQANLLKQVGVIQGLTHHFTCSSDGRCLADGKAFVPSQQMIQEAMQKGREAFLAPDPKSRQPFVYVLRRRVASEGITGFSINADRWIKVLASFERTHYPVELSFMDASGRLVASTNPALKKKDLHIFQPDEWKKWEHSRTIFDLFQSQKKDFALQIDLDEADFSLLVSIPSSALSKIEGKGIFINLAYLLLLILVIGGLVTIWLTRRMARPMSRLHEVMDCVAKGDLTACYEADSMGFEINALGDHFNHMVGSLLENIETVRIERFAKEALAKELNIGHDIQKSLLPEALDSFGPLTIAAALHPAREVAGDFYDLFRKSEDELMLVVADGSDKGISACLYSLMVRSMLRLKMMGSDNLPEALMTVNDLFCQDTGDTGNFVTAWIAIFNAKTSHLTFCSMGHFPAYLIREGKAQSLTTKGQALGAGPMDLPVTKTIPLEKGDLLFIYTDGLIEARNAEGEMFGPARLIELLEQNQYKTPREIVELLNQQVEEFSPEASQQDDLTALAVKL
ncbi:MAG: Phosphoserine phosphatase RsbU [Chlamydiae bacterium]|nr:Phosphoserine phosphatase RsbU [Chlamydiota bacterium]